jgi:hypothetical protein
MVKYHQSSWKVVKHVNDEPSRYKGLHKSSERTDWLDRHVRCTTQRKQIVAPFPNFVFFSSQQPFLITSIREDFTYEDLFLFSIAFLRAKLPPYLLLLFDHISYAKHFFKTVIIKPLTKTAGMNDWNWIMRVNSRASHLSPSSFQVGLQNTLRYPLLMIPSIQMEYLICWRNQTSSEVCLKQVTYNQLAYLLHCWPLRFSRLCELDCPGWGRSDGLDFFVKFPGRNWNGRQHLTS